MKKLLFASAVILCTAMFALPASAATNKTLGSYDTGGRANDITIVNNYAYVADGSDGVIVLNVSNPAAPTLAGSYDTAGTATRVEASGTVLVVADTTSVQFLNITNPLAPTPIGGGYSQGGLTVNDVTTDGTYVYIIGSLTGVNTFEIVNISNPSAPSLVNSLAINAGSSISMSGTTAYVVGNNFLDIVNTSPVLGLAGEYVGDGSSVFTGVEINGSLAYINDSTNSLQVVNIANPAAPVKTYGTIGSGGQGGGLATSNGYLFVTASTVTNGGGLFIYDIYHTGQPVYVDTYTSPASTFAVTVADTVAWVAAEEQGVVSVDISKPDTVPPVITLKGSGGKGTVPPVITVGGKYVDPGATGIDNADGSLTVTVSGSVDTTTVGRYVLTYTVTDRAGNTTKITRTVIIAPSIMTILGKSGVYTQKVGTRKLTFRPFLSYGGTIIARKLVTHKISDPMFLFIATSPYRRPALVLYNYQGKVLSRLDLTKFSVKGLHVDLASDPSTLAVILSLNPTVASTTDRIYVISKNGLRQAGTATVASKASLIIEKLLKVNPNEVGLVTMVRNKTSTVRVWRYNGKTKIFVRDTKYPLNKLKLTGTSIALK